MSHATQSKDFKNVPCAALKKKYSRNLGLYTDKHLNWQPQIQHVNNELARSIGILSKLRYAQYIDFNILKQIYYALIYPYLSYVVQLLGDVPEKLS